MALSVCCGRNLRCMSALCSIPSQNEQPDSISLYRMVLNNPGHPSAGVEALPQSDPAMRGRQSRKRRMHAEFLQVYKGTQSAGHMIARGIGDSKKDAFFARWWVPHRHTLIQDPTSPTYKGAEQGPDGSGQDVCFHLENF